MTDNQGALLCAWARTPARACACVIWLTAQQRVWMDSVKAQTLMQLHTGRFMMWNTKGKETMITFMRCHFPPLLSEEFVEFYASFFPIMCPPCPKWAFVRGLCLQRLDLILSNKAQVGCLYSSICPHTCTYLSCIGPQFHRSTWEPQSLIFQNQTANNTFLSSLTLNFFKSQFSSVVYDLFVFGYLYPVLNLFIQWQTCVCCRDLWCHIFWKQARCLYARIKYPISVSVCPLTPYLL